MNKENLLKMASHIRTIPQGRFSMRYFRIREDILNDIFLHFTHECNSVGCAIGHCVILDKWENVPFVLNNAGIDYIRWSYNFTDLLSEEWDWCFHSNWCVVDNTPIGAAKRIEWLVEHGLPNDWLEQMDRRAELCY